MRVPLGRPSIEEHEIARVVEVLRSGWLAHGPCCTEFEESMARYLGVAAALCMNSCTSALEVALSVAGIRGEVIVPSFTFVATANAVALAGGRPVFCEIDGPTRNVTAATIAACITPRTEAVMPVHFGGQPCRMDEIVALCERHQLLLVEDSAETLGATFRGQQAGSFGLGCFSFYPTKNMTTFEGGVLACRDAAFAERARAAIAHGITTSAADREHSARPWYRAAARPGHNYRLSNVAAALGCEQLKRLDAMNARRVELARRYDEALAPLGLRTPVVAPHATHVYQMYTVELDAAIRDAFVAGLRARGVGASVHFDPPAHVQPAYRELGWRAGQLPVTERLAEEIVTLPLFPDLSFEEQDWVVEQVRLTLAACRG